MDRIGPKSKPPPGLPAGAMMADEWSWGSWACSPNSRQIYQNEIFPLKQATVEMDSSEGKRPPSLSGLLDALES
jgi:hypothetical protein